MAKIKTKKYYAYLLTDINKYGICDNWKDCEKLVSGKNARHRGFETQSEAETWLKDGANYEIKPPKTAKKLGKGIYFDSGTGRNQKVEISVTDETGKDLLDKVIPKIKINKFGKHSVPKATNNYGELLACKYALQLALKTDVKKIFGDSQLVLNYWAKGYINKKENSKKTIKLAEETAKFRNEFENNGGIISFIEGDYNPADLGFHR